MTDTRDLRDPAAFGEAILELRNYSDRPASQLADHAAETCAIPPFSSSASTVDETVEAYRRKMQEQAAQGDLASLRTLLDKGWALPQDLPAHLIERARQMRSADAEVTDDLPARVNAQIVKEISAREIHAFVHGDAPRPTDGPDYHAEKAFYEERRRREAQ